MMIMRPPRSWAGRALTERGADRIRQQMILRCALGHGEQLASTSDIGSAGLAVQAEQPVVTDAMQALGQHMDQEAPDELMRGQRHGLVPAGPLDPIILPLEGDAGLVG